METLRRKYSRFILDEMSYKTDWAQAHHQVFEVSNSPQAPICPPEQVFKSQYKFLFKKGGFSFAEDEKEYSAWIECFRSVGDKQFAIVENIGATETERTSPERTVFPVDTIYSEYEAAEEALHNPHPFRLGTNHYHIFGKSANWGVYLSEWPTLLIIGCKPEFIEMFRKKLTIKDNGYTEQEAFIEMEFGFANLDQGYELFKQHYLNQARRPIK